MAAGQLGCLQPGLSQRVGRRALSLYATLVLGADGLGTPRCAAFVALDDRGAGRSDRRLPDLHARSNQKCVADDQLITRKKGSMNTGISIQFLNHASVKILTDTVSIVSDPWLWGTIFNNGWDLIVDASEQLFPIAAESDFIWISHEHPDHFSPAFFRRLHDRKPHVLFQATRDSRVAQYLAARGF